MKENMLNKLVNSDKINFQTFYDEIGDESYKKINKQNLRKLLKIENKKIRFECVNAITNKTLFRNESLVPFVIDIFYTIQEDIIADYVSFAAIDEQLINSGKLKYFTLLSFLAKLRDEEKARHIYNIFTNNNIISLFEKEYIKYLLYCMDKSEEELELIENNICNHNNIKKGLKLY